MSDKWVQLTDSQLAVWKANNPGYRVQENDRRPPDGFKIAARNGHPPGDVDYYFTPEGGE